LISNQLRDQLTYLGKQIAIRLIQLNLLIKYAHAVNFVTGFALANIGRSDAGTTGVPA